ncbi:MAG: YMGG-like glycine zipper-containing protein [Terriglobales bacterium]
MRTHFGWMLIALLFLVPATFADTIILHDGSSYSGSLVGITNNTISFTDNAGAQYKFPESDVQTMVFTSSGDTVTLRNGRVYSGKYNGPIPISFQDAEGIAYQFPLNDVESLVFSRSSPPPVAEGGRAVVIPEGSEISIRTDENINSETSGPGQLYSASVEHDVPGVSGIVAIPRGASAKLLIRNVTSGGAVHSPELALDLFSVTVNGKEHRVVTSDVDVNNRNGVGGNRRTAEFAGGGAGLGALVGAIFGGGKGAAIGAASGAGGGLLTQIFTRGKKISVPAESTLTFRLDRTLVLKPLL